MVKKKTSIVIDDQLWKEFRKYAIDHDKDLSELLEEMLKERVKK
jgi:macrodomain Ter protein organizer (MatP/YcbG family)